MPRDWGQARPGNGCSGWPCHSLCAPWGMAAGLALGLEVHPADLPVSPYSVPPQLRPRHPQHFQPDGTGAIPGSCTQKASQAAGDWPHKKPFPIARSGLRLPESAPKMPWHQPYNSPRCSDQHHRGPRGLPLCLHAGGNPGSEGGPTLEADPQWGVALRLPAAGPEEAVGAGPGSGDRPGHQAAPGPNIAEDVPAAGPKGGAEAATLFHPHVTVVLPSGKENKP